MPHKLRRGLGAAAGTAYEAQQQNSDLRPALRQAVTLAAKNTNGEARWQRLLQARSAKAMC